MTRFAIVFMTCVLAASPALAAPKTSSTGKTCESTGTATKDGKDQDGNTVSCTRDTCTFTECSTSGGQISNCVRKTEYSNPRNCTAKRAMPGKSAPLVDKLQNLQKLQTQ